MAGYDQKIRVKVKYVKEAKDFFTFLNSVGKKYARPIKIKYRYLGRGYFYVLIDGGSGGIDALFQELIINRGLYYYACTLKNKKLIIENVIIPIFSQLIDNRFSNSQSRFLRKHILGKHSQTDFIPTDVRNRSGYKFATLFRRWDLKTISNKDYVISLDALITQFLLEKLEHPQGARSPQFRVLLNRFKKNFLLFDDTERAFNSIHKKSRGALHRLETLETKDVLYELSMPMMNYFEYLDDFELSQNWKTIKVRGKRYKRVKYGNEVWLDNKGKPYLDDDEKPIAWDANKPCHDCNVLRGMLHVEGCDAEICPKCNGQFMSCGGVH